jgi:hypothetical protein
MRNACKAQTEGTSDCGNIRDNDQRNYCKAQQGSGGCQNIKDDGLRNQCKSMAP